jgi:hypothetical protein
MGDLWDDEAAGRIVLGGCVVEPRSPSWCCAAGHKWRDPAQRLRVDGAAAVFTSTDPPTD